ncbi:GerMN domain-containing protein [Actinomycetaceae bacterium TAE3-ERU4]|nr:GerMN domain-containing protein [Actinomycetaceae bacterium TAE3-ERU4]
MWIKTKRSFFWIFLALFSSFLLSACGALPVSGPVEATNVDLPEDSRSIQNAPLPAKDSSPESLLRDFLAACRAGAFSANYDGARQYLLPGIASSWKPEEEIHLYPGDVYPKFEVAGEDRIILRVPSKGALSVSGVYSLPAVGENLAATFSFARNSEGQWRISSLPDGLILAQSAFQSAYSKQSLFFLTPDASRLVPDVRWVPTVKAASYLTELLLAGPSDELKNVVTTALPQGASLVSHTVSIVGGQAQVKISSPENVRSPAEQGMLQWQLEKTLTQLSSVLSVSVSINDSLISANSPETPKTVTEAAYIKGKTIVTAKQERVLLNNITVAQGELSNLALSPRSSSQMAFLVSGKDVIRADATSGEQILLYSAEGVSGPNLDAWGWTWIANRQPGRGIIVFPSKGTSKTIKLPYTNDGFISFRLSNDGIRLLAIRSGASPAIDLLRVKRDNRGEPQSLDLITSFPLSSGVLAWPAWESPTTPVVLLRDDANQRVTLMRLPLGAEPNEVNAPSRANYLAASEQTNELLVTNDVGHLFQRDGRRWTLLGTGAAYPAFTD